MLKRSSLVGLFVSLLVAVPANAESTARRDSRVGNQTILVRVEYKSSLSCEYIADIRRGAPAGGRVQPHQLPLTVLIARDGACHNQQHRLRRNKTAFGGLRQHDVKLFFVATNGRLLLTESFVINDY